MEIQFNWATFISHIDPALPNMQNIETENWTIKWILYL